MSALIHRPSIDGLRSIAVISVLLFHLHNGLLPGGFVGVDVFFVISGYLISSIILKDCERAQFSLLKFYQRRIARIFPLFFLVSFATLLAASRWYSPQDYASAGAVAVASVLSVANLKFMLQGNYFELSPDASPFLHFWSLSLEEQFYFFLPIAMAFGYRFRATRSRLSILIGVSALGSFGACIWMTKVNPEWAFYLLPTRAWELLAGSLLAVVPRNHVLRPSHRTHQLMGTAGLIGILLSLFMIHDGTNFPGFIAVLPVLSTVLIIGVAPDERVYSERLLSHPILTFIGKISYSLYLWHWPIYCFTDYVLFEQAASVRLVLKLTLTISLALASFFLFEQPARRFFNAPARRKPAYAAFAVGLVLFAVAGTFIRSSHYVNASLDSIADGGVVFNKQVASPTIVLMGDSNGSMYGTTMKSLAERLQARVHVISVAAGNPFPDSDLYKSSIAFIEKTQPDIVVFAAAWAEKLKDKNELMEVMLDDIRPHTRRVMLITQPPRLPEAASRAFIRENGMRPIFEEPTSKVARTAANAYLLSLRGESVDVLDVEPYFTRNDGQIRLSDGRGKPLFHDSAHLSGYGAHLIQSALQDNITSIIRADVQISDRNPSPYFGPAVQPD